MSMNIESFEKARESFISIYQEWAKDYKHRSKWVAVCEAAYAIRLERDEARCALRLLHATRYQGLYEQGITKPKDRIDSMIMANATPYTTDVGLYTYAELYRLHKQLSNMAAFCEDVIGSTTDPMMVSMVHEGRGV